MVVMGDGDTSIDEGDFVGAAVEVAVTPKGVVVEGNFSDIE